MIIKRDPQDTVDDINPALPITTNIYTITPIVLRFLR